MSTTYLIIVIASWIVWLGFAALTSLTITRLRRELRAAREDADDYRRALELLVHIARLEAARAAIIKFNNDICVATINQRAFADAICELQSQIFKPCKL